MAEHINGVAQVPDALTGFRFDQVAAQLFSDYSRARLQRWIESGELTVDGCAKRPRDKLCGGETLRLHVVTLDEPTRWLPETLPLNILYEDTAILVLDKPAGLVVHPAAGHHSGTLLNALLQHCPDLASIPRAGIVHRLDKDTSGIMVVAKTLAAQHHLVEQLQQRTAGREYDAVCQGVMTGGGTVDAPIGRHSKQRKKMAVVAARGKPAITHYRIVQRFGHYTYCRCRLDTGRTHQIRVHMAAIHHPLCGDPLYGGRSRLPKGASTQLVNTLQQFRRQALHARQLTLIHPLSGEQCSWQAPLPDDLQYLLAVLGAED